MAFPSVRELRQSRNRDVLRLLEDQLRTCILKAKAEVMPGKSEPGAVTVLMSLAALEGIEHASGTGEPFDRQGFVDLALDIADWAQEISAPDEIAARDAKISA